MSRKNAARLPLQRCDRNHPGTPDRCAFTAFSMIDLDREHSPHLYPIMEVVVHPRVTCST
ncbi:MAG: hypothetical protein AAFY04_05995 [Pseudomonadota bacterium]